jgi:hypothetical protein
VGKSALAYRLAHAGTRLPRRTIRVSLTNAPSVEELLKGMLSLFPERDTQAVGAPMEQLMACLTDEA